LIGFFITPLHLLSQTEGRMRMQRYIFDANSDWNNVKITTNVWYCGSQSVQEVSDIAFISDSLGKRTTVNVKYYLFIDSALNLHLYFTSFSDTAVLVAKSNKPDLFSKYGGWNLYSKVEFDYDRMLSMDDTVVNGKQLSRYNLIKTKGKDLFNFIFFASCSQKSLPLIYVRSIARKIGCPIIRMDTYYNGQLSGRMDIDYVTTQLSTAEKKVFRAWQRRSKDVRSLPRRQ
jgi:hypothetical protein